MTQLKPHQQRVVTEKSELDDKLAKLNSFFMTSIYDNLNADEKARLQRQAEHMRAYSDVLYERIAAFN